MKREEHFRQDLDEVLRHLSPSEELKQRVFARIDQMAQGSAQPVRSAAVWRRALIAALVLFVLTAGAWQVPAVRAAVLPALTAAVSWIEQVTKIPIRLPGVWEPREEKQHPQGSHYYFEAFRTPDDYSINVYYVKVPVEFNNEKELLEKDGPLSESQREGSISGKKKTANMPPLAVTIPADAQPFELQKGLTAYQKAGGTAVYWQQGHWGMEYVGPTGEQEELKQVASMWEGTFRPLADTGTVKMVQGNRLTMVIAWEEGDVRYTFQTADLKHLPQILSSLQEWKQTHSPGSK